MTAAKRYHTLFTTVSRSKRGTTDNSPDSKVHGANIGPTWVLSAPGGPPVCPVNLSIRDVYSIDMDQGILSHEADTCMYVDSGSNIRKPIDPEVQLYSKYFPFSMICNERRSIKWTKSGVAQIISNITVISHSQHRYFDVVKLGREWIFNAACVGCLAVDSGQPLHAME